MGIQRQVGDFVDSFPKELLLTARGRNMYAAALRAKLLIDAVLDSEESDEDDDCEAPVAKRRCFNPITGSRGDEESEESCEYSDESESESTIPSTLELITVRDYGALFHSTRLIIAL